MIHEIKIIHPSSAKPIFSFEYAIFLKHDIITEMLLRPNRQMRLSAITLTLDLGASLASESMLEVSG